MCAPSPNIRTGVHWPAVTRTFKDSEELDNPSQILRTIILISMCTILKYIPTVFLILKKL